MPRNIPRLLWVVLPLAYFVYLFDLSGTGLLGPDEPRYASIAREMARSGDWITPRLWGEPWFEKPALLYWMSGAAYKLGLGPELAPRLPVALLAVAFLVFFWWFLRAEFGERAAWMATLILGTSAFWVGYSQNGVTDIPLAATYSAAMLFAMPWVTKRDTRWLPLASALFGLAVLAKGLVPLALALPLLSGRHIRDWLRWRVVLPFCAVALPWYALCYARNGWPFIRDFFVVHHFSRITSNALMHERPWWFYLPVLLAALLPWSPLLGLLAARSGWTDRRRLFLGIWAATVLVLFSIAVNKLPGYILPGLPALSILMALRIDEAGESGRWWLAACALLLIAFPIGARLLPDAVRTGLSHAARPAFQPLWLAWPALAVVVLWLDLRGRRLAAVLTVAIGAAAGVAVLKSSATPELDRSVSARGFWRTIENRRGDICLADVKRDWEYGLNYYAIEPLPKCAENPRPLEVVRAPGDQITLQARP